MPYFDHMATNPLDPEVLDAMLPYFKEDFGNPLSIYELGSSAKAAIEKAREETASLIGAKPSSIVFTANGAEANNFALRGVAIARQNEGKHIIVSKVEHHSVLNAARFLEKSGWTVTYLPVDEHGLVQPDVLRRSITDETTLVSIIHASPEVGSIQNIKELSAIAKERKVTFHTDAVASAGNILVDVEALGVDLLSMSAHQFYGPKGAGALYIKPAQRIVPLIYGGIQEGGRRAGTENVPAIVGMGRAALIAKEKMQERMKHVKPLRDMLVEAVLKVPDVRLTGHPVDRLPGHASFTVEYIEGEAMLLMFSALDILVASGSACSSKALKSSPVLLSMGVPTGRAQGSIVFSLGKDNTLEDIEKVKAEFPRVVTRLREISPFAKGWGDAGEEGATCIPKK